MLSEMVKAYLAGWESGSDTLPDCYKHCSPGFKHGWLNGRDDRIGKPRDKAQVLRARAEIIKQNCSSCSSKVE